MYCQIKVQWVPSEAMEVYNYLEQRLVWILEKQMVQEEGMGAEKDNWDW